LEIIAVLILVQGNSYQGSRILRSANRFTGFVYNTSGSIGDYLSLKRANKDLAEENARLHNTARSAYIITDTSAFLTRDSIYQQQYYYMPARVISNTTSKRNNYLMLNKGRIHGILPDMAVVSPAGVVGIINEVSDHYSSVISVLHRRTGISARIVSNNQVGSLVWDGRNYRQGTLMDVPAHARIVPGDTVVTSGYSHIFPAGTLIGTILEYSQEPGNNFYTITLDFSVDYNRLKYVEVVQNLLREEQETLEENSLIE
jgi:rod shape-determining protein MreC